MCSDRSQNAGSITNRPYEPSPRPSTDGLGVPHYNNRALGSTFAQNISVAGGAASVTTYDKQFLLKAVLDGYINPGRVFTHSYSLDEIDQAYKDMDERKTIKAMIVLE